MYAGTTFRSHSGKIVGVHQKIDRIARDKIIKFVPDLVRFPTTKEIIHFEGKNGPDAIRYMSPAIDKPWHFIDPTKPDDRMLLQMIDNHIINLADAMKSGDNIRSAFECSWLAHAVVDGLTPSHHYPLHDKIDGRWRGSRKNGEYARFMVAILKALSADCEHQFPPKDYQVPKGYDFYGESAA